MHLVWIIPKHFWHEIPKIVLKKTKPTLGNFVVDVQEAMCLDNLAEISLLFLCKFDGV
jgi:hypothetical protein